MQAATAAMVLVDGEDFVVALDDLAALADVVGARANSLSLIPAGSAGLRTAAEAGFQSLDTATQSRLAVALAVLRAPGKMAHWHTSVADETVSRAALAWSSSVKDSIVVLAGSVDPRRVTFWTQASLTASIRKTLAAGDPLRDDEIGCKVSTSAVVVFLAVLDQLRAARLHSLLTHTAPSVYFAQAEIMDRLRESVSEDFRWPLLFSEKLIPGCLVTSLTEAEVAAALGELAHAGLVENASAGRVPRYELSNAGKLIAGGVLHDVSKVGLGVTDRQGQDQLGRDILLLVRSSFHLFMFAMAGQTGAIAALTNDELAAALHFSLRPPEPPAAVVANTATPPPPSKQWHFTRAGQTEGPVDEASLRRMLPSLPPDTMVWNQDLDNWITARDAGLVPPPVANVCPQCGTSSKPGQRFCAGCGRPLGS